ncbi:MAG: glycosyltransferase family 4 protein [Syntrophales bacterium]
MKILLVGAYPPPHGGVEVHVRHLEKYLLSRGHDCFVMNMGKNKELAAANLSSPKYALQAAFLLFRMRDRLCHLHFGGTLHIRLILLTLFSNFVFQGRCVLTIHSGGLPQWGTPKGITRRTLMRTAFSGCGAVICVNREIKEYFMDLGINTAKLHIISPFAFSGIKVENSIPSRIKDFMKKKSTLLCSVGGLEPEYGVEFLIGAFKKYLRHRPDSALVIIGCGSLEKEIRTFIRNSSLQENVLLTGDLGHRQTLAVMSSSHCFIRPSFFDGDCISLREAIHIGIPAIASDNGMRPEGTILFPIGDEDKLLERMLQSTSTPPLNTVNTARSDYSALSEVEKVLFSIENQPYNPGM